MKNNSNKHHNDESYREGMVHVILSNSYTVFLLAVVIGLVLDVIIPTTIFEGPIYQYSGMIMIMLGSVIIYWAQSTTSCTKKEEKSGAKREFARGPYKYNRKPTHVGLSIMTLGLGFLLHSVFSVALIVIAYIITKSVFIRKEEDLLEKKYGEVYCEYKKKVRNWI